MAVARIVSLSLVASALGAMASGGPVAWQATAEDVEVGLIAELAGLLRGGPHRLEGALGPVYDALPKNAHGRLEPQAVRSALRRLFLQRPGWTLKGLEPGGGAEAWVPGYLQKLVADRTSGHGAGLRELAAMAATLEELIRNEATFRLEGSYQTLGLPLAGHSERAQVVDALHLYAKAYLGSNASAAPASDWLRRLDPEHWLAAGARSGAPSFQDAGRAALAMERQLSRFQARECAGLRLAAAEARCIDVSSLYMLCCRSDEEAPVSRAPEPSEWEEMRIEFPGLLLFSFACFSLSALGAAGRRLCGCWGGGAVPSEAAGGDAAKPAAAGDGEERAGAAEPALKVGPLASGLAWCLLCGGAVAADLLDVAVIAPALLGGLALVAAARLAPKQPAKAKKV